MGKAHPIYMTNNETTTQPESPARRFRFARAIIALSMLVMGACGIIYEYVLGVLGNNLMGSSYEQIFVIIGVMMFAMGIGAVFQRHLSRNLVDWFLQIELLLGFLGGISSLVIYTTFVYTTSHQLALYSFAFSIGLLIGLEIPLLIRINTEYSESLRVNLSDILCMDYVGSLLGALLFAYVLLTRLSIGKIGLMLGCVNTLLAILGLIYFWPLVKRQLLIAVSCSVSLALLICAMVNVNPWMARLEQRCFEDPIIHSQTTLYQHLVLTKAQDRVRLYINGNLQFCSLDEAIYHEMLVHTPMAIASKRNRVLILGGGDGLALREVLRYGEVQDVTLVDIDPEMIRMASEHPEMIRLNHASFDDARVHNKLPDGIEKGEQTTIQRPTKLANMFLDSTQYDLADVHVYTVDADQFIRSLGEDRYDVVIIDFPDPRCLELAKLYSVNFYRSLKAKLNPEAVISIQSTSPRRARKVFLCIAETLKAAGYNTLPYHDYMDSFGDWGFHLAWLGEPDKEQVRQKLKNLDKLSVGTYYATAEVINAGFVFGKDWLKRDEAIKASTNMQPVVIKYYQQSFR